MIRHEGINRQFNDNIWKLLFDNGQSNQRESQELLQLTNNKTNNPTENEQRIFTNIQ